MILRLDIGSSALSIREGFGVLAGIVDINRRAVLEHKLIAYRWGSHDDRLIELSLKPFLNYLEMEKPKEAAAEAKAKARELSFSQIREASLSMSFSMLSLSSS